MAKKPEEKEKKAIVKVKALRNINTTLYGSIKEGKEAELPAEFAEQLTNSGDCIILE